MFYRWQLAATAALFCSACAIGPKYQPPVAQAPVNFKELAGNDQWKMATPSDDLIKGKWWEIFGDPQLNALEEMVNINNQNVKQAEAQFLQARALVDLQHAGYYPTIGSTPAVHNAVCDAVAHLGVRHVDMPTTPTRVWRAIQDATAGRS